jgi:hypothetical protein
MTKKSWTIQLENESHTVDMEHNLFSNKRTIRVDDQVVEQGSFSAIDLGGDYFVNKQKFLDSFKLIEN